jgi:hypothetical protein
MSPAVDAPVTHREGTPLEEWASAHESLDGMVYQNAYRSQIGFVQDRLSGLFFGSYEEWSTHPVRVVGEHRSQSIRLPVFSILVPGELEVRLRGNFHDWVVSVSSTASVPDVFYELFERDARQPLECSEGFDPDWVFGPYTENNRQFSLRLSNDLRLYVFCYLLLGGLGMREGLKP